MHVPATALLNSVVKAFFYVAIYLRYITYY